MLADRGPEAASTLGNRLLDAADSEKTQEVRGAKLDVDQCCLKDEGRDQAEPGHPKLRQVMEGDLEAGLGPGSLGRYLSTASWLLMMLVLVQLRRQPCISCLCCKPLSAAVTSYGNFRSSQRQLKS